MKYPKTIQTLIEYLKKLPGVGEKTAERYALALLNMDEEFILEFSKILKDLKIKTKHCVKCNNLCEGDLCEVCKQSGRDESVLCVVESPKNLVIFERLGVFNGLYYVLGGLISPLDGVNPDDINIELLIDRIDKEKIKEIILALKPGIEGETTSLYISKLLEGKDVKITKIAHGIPIGIDMEYIDALTLEFAIEDRTKM